MSGGLNRALPDKPFVATLWLVRSQDTVDDTTYLKAMIPHHSIAVMTSERVHINIMGATNPANAEPGTIRKELAESIEEYSVHGSDSDENAAIEIAYFFEPKEIVG